MGKKKKKKIKEKRIEAKPQTISIFERIDKILSIRWVPIIIFLLLSIIYFNELIFQPVAFTSTEGGASGYGLTGGAFKDFYNPFKENRVWANTFMGGHPEAQWLKDITPRIFFSIALIFLKDYKVVTIWIVILTFCAGLFMFLYMRTMGLKKSSAMIIGVAYMFAPMFMSLTYALHYSKMGVMAILPLIFLNIEKGMREGKFRYFLYLGGCIALAVGTAHLQFVYFSILGSGLYFVFKLILGIKNKEKFNLILRKIILYGFALIMGLGLSARYWLPQYFHTSNVSKRAYTVVEGRTEEGVGIETGSSWSLHPEEIFSFLLPEFGNYKEFYWGRNGFKINAEYFGSIILLLSVISLIFLKKNINILFFLVLFVFSVLFSLGSHTPVHKICYYILPGMKRLRGPGMIAILSCFSAMVMAGISLEYLINKAKEGGKIYKNAYIILGVAGLISFLFIALPQGMLSIWKNIFYSDIPQQKLDVMNLNVPNITEGSVILLINIFVLFTCLYLYQRKKIGGGVLALILIPMIIIDTWRIDKNFLGTIPVTRARQEIQQKYDAYEFIKQNDKTVFRVFPDHAAQMDIFNRFRYEGISMVTGFLDFTLWRYDNFLKNFNLNSLNLSNAKYIVSVRDFPQDYFELVYLKDNVRVYLNKNALPLYYVRKNWVLERDENKVLSMITGGSVDLLRRAIIEKEPPSEYQGKISEDSDEVVFLNEDMYYSGKLDEYNFKVNSSSPGLLIVSDNYHPNWNCYIDGKEAEVYRANYLWKGVFFPAGTHEISFKFIAKEINLSRKIMFSCMGLFLIMFLFVSVKDYRSFPHLISKFKKQRFIYF